MLEPQGAVSRWESGQAAFRLSTLRAIERALDLDPGALLVRSGFVRLPSTVEQTIENDAALAAEGRRLVLAVYAYAVRASRMMPVLLVCLMASICQIRHTVPYGISPTSRTSQLRVVSDAGPRLG